MREMNDPHKEALKSFGKRVAEVRRSRGMTQHELADNIGMNITAVSLIENGRRWVRPGTLAKIAEYLKVDLSDLFRST